MRKKREKRSSWNTEKGGEIETLEERERVIERQSERQWRRGRK